MLTADNWSLLLIKKPCIFVIIFSLLVFKPHTPPFVVLVYSEVSWGWGGILRSVSWMDVLRILLIFACPFVHGHWLTKYFCQECKAKGKINNILPNQHSSPPRAKPMNNFSFFFYVQIFHEWMNGTIGRD